MSAGPQPLAVTRIRAAAMVAPCFLIAGLKGNDIQGFSAWPADPRVQFRTLSLME